MSDHSYQVVGIETNTKTIHSFGACAGHPNSAIDMDKVMVVI